MSRLAALKAAHSKPQYTGNNNYYPFYAMAFDDRAIVRFLPDQNQNNPLGFMFEKLTHSAKGADGKDVTVPCLKMYDEECPICKASADFYKVEGKDTPRGKQLFRKRTYLTQAIIVRDPLAYKEGEEPALGKFRIVSLTPSVYSKIQTAIADDELRESPDDYIRGTDFSIKKVKKGEFANYDNSKFERDERPLSAAELAEIEGKLIDLSTLRPAKPELSVLDNFLQSFLNGSLSSGSAPSGSVPSAAAGYNAPKANPNDYLSQAAAPQASPAPASAPQASANPDDEAARVLADIMARRS